MDFSNFKLRCSSIGPVMSVPQEKTAKDAGELSKTAKTHLRKVYAQEKYGRKKDIVTKQMRKGNDCEPASIELIGLFNRREYKKNTITFENEYIKGTPDIIDEIVIDAKTSWDLETFLANEGIPLDKDYEAQLKGYLALTGIGLGQVAFCLVSSPESVVNNELMYLANKMDCLTVESPEYLEAAEELRKNMVFDDIPAEERIIRFTVPKDDEYMLRVYNKVIQCRKWLNEFDKQRTSRTLTNI